jgi:hypothetical protein
MGKAKISETNRQMKIHFHNASIKEGLKYNSGMIVFIEVIVWADHDIQAKDAYSHKKLNKYFKQIDLTQNYHIGTRIEEVT